MGQFVTVTVDADGVATFRLDRPPMNALNLQMWEELGEAARYCRHEPAVKAVVLYGGHKLFAAGADIKALSAMALQDAYASGGILQEALRAIERIPKVVIAAITGYALGGGCELALTADFRFAAADAKLGQPEIKLGLIPGAGGTQRLTRLVGLSRAKELVYGGDMIDAQRALEIGLVDRVAAADEDVYELSLAQARRYAAGPFALRIAKHAIDDGFDLALDDALRLESTLFAAAFGTDDARAGMEAFLAKEEPGFRQR